MQFLIARTARLAPTLLVASSVTLVLYFSLQQPPPLQDPIAGYLESVTLLPLLRLGNGLDWALWSLTFELRFYLLIFLCMLAFDVERWAIRIAVAMLLLDVSRTLADLMLASGRTPHTDPFGNFAPFFAIGMLLQHRYSGRRCGPTWVLAAATAIAMASLRATVELRRIDDWSLHVASVHYRQGLAVACVIPLLLALCLNNVRHRYLALACRCAGRASYPLYVVHQLSGYWILNAIGGGPWAAVDPRWLVLLGVVLAALLYGNLLEPRLIAGYRSALSRAARRLALRQPPPAEANAVTGS